MSFVWSHTTYARWRGMILNFEDAWDRDYFLAHAEGAERISAIEAWNDETYKSRDFIRVCSSRRLGQNKERARRIKAWKTAT